VEVITFFSGEFLAVYEKLPTRLDEFPIESTR
jgi:hypothetical protein